MVSFYLITLLAFFNGQQSVEQPPCQDASVAQLVRLSPKEIKSRLIYCERAKLGGNFDGKGIVTVRLVVGADGKVVCAEAMNRHPMMKDIATKTAQNWKFKPLEQRGERKAFTGVVTVCVSWNSTYGKDTCDK